MTKRMQKPMWIMLVSVGILFGGIFIYKFIQGIFEKWSMESSKAPIATVSAMQAKYSLWSPQVEAVGSMRTVEGVNVTTELAGMVQTIYFTPGAFVKKGTLLVQLNIDPDVAQLRSLEATANVDEITYKRDKAQYSIGAVSKQTLDTDKANFESAVAQVNEQKANIAKKTIRAPFTGRLGISAIYPGQYISPGDNIAVLETLDPIYVDFYLPQESVAQIGVGQPLNATVDAFPNKTFIGKITTINPVVDSNTRNVRVEGLLPNPKNELLPGMFASVKVTTGTPQRYLTLPQTAISFNSYGDIVFILQKVGKDKNGKDIIWKANQAFVITGETRGDQIAILQGVKEGDMIVTSGQIKLKNGSLVRIDNTVVPSDDPNPTPEQE